MLQLLVSRSNPAQPSTRRTPSWDGDQDAFSLPASCRFTAAAVSAFSGAISADRALAQILRAQQMARPLHQCRRRKVASAAIVLRVQSVSIPSRNVPGPVRVVGLAQKRRGAIGDSPVQQENQRTRNGTRTHHRREVQDGGENWSLVQRSGCRWHKGER